MRESKYTELEVFTPDEIRALVRAAADAQDAAIFLTAAFTGLRKGELIALRRRDVDCARSTIRVRASYAEGQLTTPKSGKVRSVPMATEVAATLALLGQRDARVGDADLVFAGIAGEYLDGPALFKPFRAARDRAGLAPRGNAGAPPARRRRPLRPASQPVPVLVVPVAAPAG